MIASLKNVAAPLAAALAAVFLWAGCSPKEAKARASTGGKPPPAARKSWNWDRHPLVHTMKIGTLPCQVQPKSVIAVQSPLAGTLRVYATAPQTNLPANFLWAEFEPEIFAAEARALEEARKKLEDQETLQYEIELPRRKMQLARQIEEAQRQVSLLRMLSTNKELADLAFNVGSAGSNPLRPDSLEKSELELHLLTQSMEYLQSTNFTALGVDLAGQRTDFERRKLEFERRQAQARFRMPFDGRLTVTLPLTEGVTEYPVATGQELGVARDLSSIRLRVPLSNLAWMSIPPERLTATVRLPSGEAIQTAFSYQKIERVQNREESVYYFEVPDGKVPIAAKLIGTDVSCELWARLDEPVRLVPKLALILHDPEAFQNRSWPLAVSALFPGSRVAIEGQTELGIIPPKPVQVSSAK